MLKEWFPELKNFRITDGTDLTSYNCIAWTLGITDEVWWWQVDAYSGNRDGDVTVSDFDGTYKQKMGYKTTSSNKAKVALFVESGKPTHGAVKVRGNWYESKLGWSDKSFRIIHRLDQLENGSYGSVYKFYGK